MLEMLAISEPMIGMYLGAGALMTVIYLMVALHQRSRKSDGTVDLLRQAIVANIEAVDEIKDGDKRLEMMLECVQQNSEAMTAVKMAVEQNSQLLQRLNMDYNLHSAALAEAVKTIKKNGGDKP